MELLKNIMTAEDYEATDAEALQRGEARLMADLRRADDALESDLREIDRLVGDLRGACADVEPVAGGQGRSGGLLASDTLGLLIVLVAAMGVIGAICAVQWMGA